MIGPAPLPLLQQRKQAAKNIFAANGGNRQGAMFLPDSAAMYAAPDGATLAGSGVGVGLLPDQSGKKSLGDEIFSAQNFIVTNAGGSAGTYVSATKTFSNGTIGSDSSYPRFLADLSLEAGQAYEISITMGGGVSRITGLGVGVPNAATLHSTMLTHSSGVFSGTIVAEGPYLMVRSSGTTTWSAQITAISVKKVLKRAIQNTLASRPTHLVAPLSGRHFFAPTTQTLVAALPNWGSCTVIWFRPKGVMDVTTETISGAYNVIEGYRAFCGLIIVQGPLTETELFILRQLAGWHLPNLGPELLPATPWTITDGLGITQDAMTVSFDGTTSIASLTTFATSGSMTLGTGKVFAVEHVRSGSNGQAYSLNISGASGPPVSVNGTGMIALVATTATSTLRFQKRTTSGAMTGTASGFSVKELQ